MPNRTDRWNLVSDGTSWKIVDTDHMLHPAPGVQNPPSGGAARAWASEILKNEGQMTTPPHWTAHVDDRGTFYEPSVTPDDLNGGGVRTLTGPSAVAIADDAAAERADRLHNRPKVNVILMDDEIKALLRAGRLQFVATDTNGRRIDITINWTE